MKKWILMLSLFVVTTAVLAGCGGKNNNNAAGGSATPSASSNASSEAGSEPVKLTFSGWLETSREGMEAVAKKFNEKYPNITVELELMDTAQYDQVYMARMASGEGSDLMALRYQLSDKKNYANGGYVYPLNDQPFLANLVDGVVDVGTYEGTVQSVPVFGDVWGVWYNKDILKKLNIDYPKSRTEFIAASQKIKDAGITPIAHGLKDNWNAWMDLWTFGWGKVGEKDPAFFDKAQAGEVKFADDPNVAWGFQHIKEFNDLGFFPKNMLGVSWESAQQMFFNGEAAFLPAGSWLLPDLRKANPAFEAGFAKAPYSDNPQEDFAAQGGYGWDLAINAKSKHTKEALLFMEFFFTPENYALYSNAAQAPGPVVKGVNVDFDPIVPDIQKAITKMNTSLHPGVAADAAFNGIQSMIAGKTTPDRIVEEMDKMMARSLKK